MPARQPRRGRLWLNDESTIRLRPERRNHVWAYDFVHIMMGAEESRLAFLRERVLSPWILSTWP